jgi:hypothetical protein
MAIPKKEPSVEMLSTFNMKKIIWTFTKKHFMGEMVQIHYFSRKKTSHITKKNL